MNRTVLASKVLDEIFAIQKHPRGALGHMEDCETEAGYALVRLGAIVPFPVPANDWEAVCISLDGKDVRLVLLQAKHQRRGALRRLVGGIVAAGLSPVIIEPVGNDMPAIMRHWGWHTKRVGHEFDQYTECRPHNPK